jgi:energy-coupling factor transporter ATP-binding protein EcfA2
VSALGSDRSTGEYPGWVREIASLLPTSALFVVSGNVRDVYLAPGASLQELPKLLKGMLAGLGYGQVGVVRAGGPAGLSAEALWKRSMAEGPPPDAPLSALADLVRIGTCSNPDSGAGRALIVLDASRAVSDPASLTDDEVAVFRGVRRAIDDQQVSGARYNPLIWVVDSPQDVPVWLCGANPRGRVVTVPVPTSSEREVLVGRLIPRLAKGESAVRIEEACGTLVNRTDALPLRAVTQILTLARQQNAMLDHLDDAVRLYKLGILDNPWKQPYLAERLRKEIREPGSGVLRSRVKGQDTAVEKALDALVRGVTGLKSAQSPSGSAKPRAALFLAGPTGVGKTELAKGLAALMFGDEEAMIRFDMSEFASSHAAERLVGAPPGFVGYQRGGELTNAVRERPFCLLLFDEIEKADHSLLDRFLQILDDGRLTDGRGDTAYFSETVIVFTSNLGIYASITHPVTGQVTDRRLAVDPAAGYQTLAASVTEKVRDHFTSVVGRPELLNRIGDNIVVFDFIRDRVAMEILDMMMVNIAATYLREHGARLELLPTARDELARACLGGTTLLMGGRGIGNVLETALVDPLARWTFERERIPATVVIESIAIVDGRGTLRIGEAR